MEAQHYAIGMIVLGGAIWFLGAKYLAGKKARAGRPPSSGDNGSNDGDQRPNEQP